MGQDVVTNEDAVASDDSPYPTPPRPRPRPDREARRGARRSAGSPAGTRTP
jgi:hypothetical protein